MRRMYKSLLAPAALLLLAVSLPTQGQDDQPRFLSLTPPEGLPIIPLMEGWVANEGRHHHHLVRIHQPQYG